jgi:hypothetical protein
MNKMMMKLAAHLMLAVSGASSLFGDGPILNVSAQEMAFRMTIPVEENLSDIEEYWSTIPQFLESLKSVGKAEREDLQRRAADQRRMVEEIARRSRGDQKPSAQPDQR